MSYGKILITRDVKFPDIGFASKGSVYNIERLCGLNQSSEGKTITTPHADVGYGIFLNEVICYVPGTHCRYVDWE